MTRRCSHCSNNGHNTRTCPARGGTAAAPCAGAGGGGGVRLFGVRLTEGVGPMKKSASMSCLSTVAAAAGGGGLPTAHDGVAPGYLSDGPVHAACSSSCCSERKKGTPWTEEEHRMFLVGLNKLGKGDWRGIARNFVVSKTPTQVASHAQKYFIRQTNTTRRKRRSSLFDMVPEMPLDELPASEEQHLSAQSSKAVPENPDQQQALQLRPDKESESKETSSNNLHTEPPDVSPFSHAPLTMPVVPAFYPAFLPVALPFWVQPPPSAPLHFLPSLATREEEMGEAHVVLKPTPVVPKEPVNADEVVGLAELSIGEAASGRMEPSALSLKLLGAPASRLSAFHINPSIAGSDLGQNEGNAIPAV